MTDFPSLSSPLRPVATSRSSKGPSQSAPIRASKTLTHGHFSRTGGRGWSETGAGCMRWWYPKRANRSPELGDLRVIAQARLSPPQPRLCVHVRSSSNSSKKFQVGIFRTGRSSRTRHKRSCLPHCRHCSVSVSFFRRFTLCSPRG